jgi:hypothetical protein
MARRYKLRNAIQLGRTSAAGAARTLSIPELAAKLQVWLDEHALLETDVAGQYVQRPPVQRAYTTQDIEMLTLFTQGAGLIIISHHGVLSFRHELIAEYFAANYLYVIDSNPQAPIPFGNELVTDIGAWSEPVAMWAGMSNNPMELAKRIANLAQSYPQHSYNALSLSLICAGVRWGPQEKNPQSLPENVSQLLVTAVLSTYPRAAGTRRSSSRWLLRLTRSCFQRPPRRSSFPPTSTMCCAISARST